MVLSSQDGGSLLVAVDEAPDHNMSVWDWSRGERGYKLLETKVSHHRYLLYFAMNVFGMVFVG